MSNRLAGETSPYLLQHALNPVDWYAWGEEALARALAEDKPIFLSIGYSACHWCHVMAHESFEDERVAATLNRHFVSIKVDREERPDLDQIYMSAVQAMTGSGGWPMSVFLTPDGRPFYGGTYFPPQPRYGMPSFTAVLDAVADAWRERRSELVSGAERVLAALRQRGADRLPGHVEPSWATLDRAFGTLRHSFDDAHGGWGGAPKFPQPMVLEFLLRYHKATGSAEALHMVTMTLESMARGGMYDQLGGGFHRYSVDGGWHVPHFEKMLYDNAQLSRVYLHGWQVTGDELFRTVVEEILDYVLREMRHPEGGFFSSQDADSEGEEGRFFVWTPIEIRATLGDGAEAQEFMAAYGVTPGGNFEGKSIPEFVGDLEQRPALSGVRRKLFNARQQRVAPGLDTKVLTSWNGLLLASLAEAARVLDRQDYYRAAEESARFVLREVRTADGRLLHTWHNGAARLNGYLEDYAYLVDGLLELYQATFEPLWFATARALADTLITHFQAPDGGFFDTSDDHETLITRPRDLQDNATPSGSAMAVTSLLRLAGFTNDARYVDIARKALAQMQSMTAEVPLGFGQWLQALAYALSRPHEIAIVGEPEAKGTQALLAVARDTYRPFQVMALGAPDPEGTPIPLLQGRGLVNGRSAAYVCRGFACQSPLSEPEALRALLES